MKHWRLRCANCGNPHHFLPFYWIGWLAYRFAMLWPFWSRRIPPFLPTAGDFIHDARGCRKHCGGDLAVLD